MTLERDLELLYEIGTMRHITRTWHQFGGVDFSNLAEHTLRLTWIAFVIAQHEDADVGRVMQLAMVHDLPETRTGDTNYLSRMYVQIDEKRALENIVEDTVVEDRVIELWKEYKAQQTLEAKIVKDADNLDPDFELMERRSVGGSQPHEQFEALRQIVAKQLHTETARRIFDAIQDTDPQSWHMNAPNRHRTGDWQSD